MTVRITWRKLRREEYPEVEIGCLNRAHRKIVHFKIPKGVKNKACPECGRVAGRTK